MPPSETIDKASPAWAAPSFARADTLALRGRSEAWGCAEAWLLLALIGAGLCLRVWHLSAEGLGDDELHKWQAAGRYLVGDFTGDDVEHPMLMKTLIAAALYFGRPFLALETVTRLPNALAGAASVLLVALLGRRLFGRRVGLLAAGLAAFSTTLIGYQRVAKEDTLLGLFLLCLCLFLAEAKAAADDGRDPSRFEIAAALSLGAMLASKYFLFLALVPLVFHLLVRRAGARWRVPLLRWFLLGLIAFIAFAALDFTPFLPSTWDYARRFVSAGGQTVHGDYFFMGRLYRNLVGEGFNGTPAWFYPVFAAVKLAPLTALCALAGLLVALRERRPAHLLLLAWLLVWFAVLTPSGSKWGRFFISVLPAFLLLAAHGAERISRKLATGLPLLAIMMVGGEAQASLSHAPHYRLYISVLGGGDRNVSWYFPHCDYFDAGMREAVAEIAADAEPGAEISSDLEWRRFEGAGGDLEYSQFYAEQYGRADLSYSLLRPQTACRGGRTCYAILHLGRRYQGNLEAWSRLGRRAPWRTVRLRGEDVVRIYRLEPGESPFPQPLGAMP